MPRNILKTLRVEVASGKRKCHSNSRHEIKQGDQHFAYDEVPGARQNICMECAPAIIAVAEQHLAKVKAELGL